jgi:hypothetical protein
MVVLVEAFRPDVDPFFGLTSGWYILHNHTKLLPGDALPEPIPSGGFTLVFETDDYTTSFCLPPESTSTQQPPMWLRCADSRTKLHAVFFPSERWVLV